MADSGTVESGSEVVREHWHVIENVRVEACVCGGPKIVVVGQPRPGVRWSSAVAEHNMTLEHELWRRAHSALGVADL